MSQAKTCLIICAGAPEPDLNCIPPLTANYKQVHYVGLDRGALYLVEGGYQLDLAIGDFDSVTPAELDCIKAHSRDFRYLKDKTEDTDTEIGLHMSIEAFPHADYYLIGVFGKQVGRLDHLIANIWLAYQPRFRPVLERLYLVNHNNFVKFMQAGHYLAKDRTSKYFSVISMTPVKGLAIEGAKYQLAKCDLPYPRALVSNEFISPDQAISISLEEGLLALVWADEKK